MRRNIVPAVAGSLADAHNDANDHLSPPKTRIDEALKQALDRLDDDARAAPWITPHTSQAPSTLLAFFDSESRMLHIANASAGRAFLGRRVTGIGGYKCQELTGSDGARNFINPDMHSRARDVDLVDGGGSGSVFPSRGELDAASVHVESIEVRDGDFLVLGSHDAWTRLDGDEAVQAVSGWMREQQEMQEQPARGGRRRAAQDRSLDSPWTDDQGLGVDWVHTMIPDLIRDVDKMFVGVRHGENAATRVLRPELKHAGPDSSGYDEYFHAAVRSGSTSNSE
jgi:serine/threonine protein phosphatase PrpC